MDGHTLALSIGFPRFPVFGRRAHGRDPSAPTGSEGDPSPGGDNGEADAGRQAWLYTYTGATILAGIGALLWSTTTVPVLPAIDPGLDGTALAGPDGGMLLWIAFGLIGSLRVLPIPGGSGVWTFHLPFIAAAMVLGGPTAGAWVGFLATIERRELESQPWYGTLANHAVMAFAAVVGGITVLVVRGALAGAGAAPPVANLVAIALGTFVLAAVANGVAAGTVMLRERLSPIAVIEILVRSFGGITLAEVGLAWVFVTLFAAVGWWAPLLLALLVLLAWPRDGVEFLDPLTKLPRDRMFRRELDGVLARTRRGLATGGLLVLFDLDGFGALNKNHGQHIGDEVLAEIGNRMRADIRTTDFAGRRGGDEFAMFYAGVADLPTARRIAARLESAIRRPIATSAGTMQVGVSIGALLVRPASEIPSSSTLMRWADDDVQIIKTAQRERRSRTGIRFNAYGAGPVRHAAEATTRVPDEPATEAGDRVTRNLDRATRLAGLAFLLVLAALTLSRVLPV